LKKKSHLAIGKVGFLFQGVFRQMDTRLVIIIVSFLAIGGYYDSFIKAPDCSFVVAERSLGGTQVIKGLHIARVEFDVFVKIEDCPLIVTNDVIS
jgi:hypothetical protein